MLFRGLARLNEEREIAAAVRSPGSRSKAERGDIFRGLVYKSL